MTIEDMFVLSRISEKRLKATRVSVRTVENRTDRQPLNLYKDI